MTSISTILVYILAILGICLIAKIFSAPIKLVMKLLANAIIGGIALIIINWIGGFFNFHIDLNFITALITGALGVPGIIVLLIIEMII